MLEVTYGNGSQAFKFSYSSYCKKFGYVDEFSFTQAIEKYFPESESLITISDELLTIEAMAKNGNEEYRKMYLYLYEKEGEKSARKFIDSIQDEINNYGGKLKAEEFLKNLDENPDKATEYINNYLAEIYKGTNDGIFNWFGNVKNTIDVLFDNDDDAYVYSMHEYETMYILQALKEKDYGLADENVYEISQSIGNMIPSILISSVTGCPTLGAVSMGIPAGGGAAHQGLVEGYSRGQAITYGVLTGVSETCLERFLGGISGIGDVNVTSFKTLLQSMGKEAIEESTQSYVDSAFRAGIFKENYDFAGTSKDAIKSGIYGAISGGIINSAMAGINYGINKDSNINDTEAKINEDISKSNILDENIVNNIVEAGVEGANILNSAIENNIITKENVEDSSIENKFINGNGLIDVKLLPLSSRDDIRIVQEKILNKEPLSFSEKLKGRDNAVTTLDDIELYSDYMYRATSYNALLDYINANAIRDNGQGKGYSAVNWYLGGTAKKYGKVIIETPANPNLFQLSDDYGGFLSGNPNVRQAHSSNENPVSFNEVTRIIFLDETGEKVLKVVELKSCPNLMEEVELGNLLHKQDKLLKIKDKLGDNFDDERQQQLDEINKKIENMSKSTNEVSQYQESNYIGNQEQDDFVGFKKPSEEGTFDSNTYKVEEEPIIENPVIKEPDWLKAYKIENADLIAQLPENFNIDYAIPRECLELVVKQYNLVKQYNNISLENNVILTKEGKLYLPEGTLIHGAIHRIDKQYLESIKENGLLSAEFLGEMEDGETCYCADFWRIEENYTMENYYNWYNEPYIDEKGYKRRRQQLPYLPHSNEFMDSKSIAFVVNPSEQLSEFLQYDFYRNNENTDTMSKIVTSNCNELKEQNGAVLSAVLAGVPSSGISGILVTPKLSQDVDYINNLKTIFPHCYIALANDGTILYMPSDIHITEYNGNQ